MKHLLLPILVLLCGCAQTAKNKNISKADATNRAERIFRAREQALQDKRDKDRLLAQKLKAESKTDEVLFQQAHRAFTQRNYGEALKSYNSLLTQYPQSTRRASALYNKAIVLKRMNLDEQAERVFKDVKRQYPGSLESRRSQDFLSKAQR